jgi:mannose/fructose/N-acetylgalactosamine-specific phosphotransferase system component IIC
MESLALIVSLIILGRIAYVALCVALVVTFIDYRYVDGILQAQPGMPQSPWFVAGLCVVQLGSALALAVMIRQALAQQP